MKTSKELQAELLAMDDNLWSAQTQQELAQANLEIQKKTGEYNEALKREAAEAKSIQE